MSNHDGATLRRFSRFHPESAIFRNNARNWARVRFVVFRVFSVMLPVRQTLAFGSLNGKRRPFPIINAELGAIGIPEIKFVEVPLQMLVGAMLVRALHAPFENREVTFDGIRGDVAALTVTEALPLTGCRGLRHLDAPLSPR